MTKVVYNACYGGFSLSDAGVKRYAEIKGIALYPEGEGWNVVYWTVPPDQRPKKPTRSASNDKWREYNDAYEKNTIYSRDLERTDPVLVQVVEELGKDADGDCAKLRVADIPAGTQYRITEYDGYEGIETAEAVDWSVA